MATTRERDDTSHRDVNMTPLIDVSLVLVVILLLATPLAFESAISVHSTETRGKKAERSIKDESVELALVSDDVVEVNRVPVYRGSLGEALRPLLGSDEARVVVSCADNVSYGAFVNVLDTAKLSGAATISVMGRKP